MVTAKQLRKIAGFTDEQLETYLGNRNRARNGFIPAPEHVMSWLESNHEDIFRTIDQMEEPSMLYMAISIVVTDGQKDFAIMPVGYNYVCTRIKSDETPERERKDLIRVRRVCNLISESNDLKKAIDNGDFRKINRIINRRRGVTA